MVKKKTSLMIDEDIWQDVKIHCIKQKIDISEWLENLIEQELKAKKRNV